MQKLPCRIATKNDMCVVTDICRNICIKCTTNWTMTSQILLYHNAYNMYHILYMMTNTNVHDVTKY